MIYVLVLVYYSRWLLKPQHKTIRGITTMSQQKVDKYKEEKKNRKKTIKLNRVKKALAVFVICLGLGAIIGIPLGKKLYNYQKEEAKKHATIASTDYEGWFDKNWNEKYSDFGGNDDLQQLLDQFNSATYTDASSSDAQ